MKYKQLLVCSINPIKSQHYFNISDIFNHYLKKQNGNHMIKFLIRSFCRIISHYFVIRGGELSLNLTEKPQFPNVLSGEVPVRIMLNELNQQLEIFQKNENNTVLLIKEIEASANLSQGSQPLNVAYNIKYGFALKVHTDQSEKERQEEEERQIEKEQEEIQYNQQQILKLEQMKDDKFPFFQNKNSLSQLIENPYQPKIEQVKGFEPNMSVIEENPKEQIKEVNFVDSNRQVYDQDPPTNYYENVEQNDENFSYKFGKYNIENQQENKDNSNTEEKYLSEQEAENPLNSIKYIEGFSQLSDQANQSCQLHNEDTVAQNYENAANEIERMLAEEVQNVAEQTPQQALIEEEVVYQVLNRKMTQKVEFVKKLEEQQKETFIEHHKDVETNLRTQRVIKLIQSVFIKNQVVMRMQHESKIKQIAQQIIQRINTSINSSIIHDVEEPWTCPTEDLPWNSLVSDEDLFKNIKSIILQNRAEIENKAQEASENQKNTIPMQKKTKQKSQKSIDEKKKKRIKSPKERQISSQSQDGSQQSDIIYEESDQEDEEGDEVTPYEGSEYEGSENEIEEEEDEEEEGEEEEGESEINTSRQDHHIDEDGTVYVRKEGDDGDVYLRKDQETGELSDQQLKIENLIGLQKMFKTVKPKIGTVTQTKVFKKQSVKKKATIVTRKTSIQGNLKYLKFNEKQYELNAFNFESTGNPELALISKDFIDENAFRLQNLILALPIVRTYNAQMQEIFLNQGLRAWELSELERQRRLLEEQSKLDQLDLLKRNQNKIISTSNKKINWEKHEILYMQQLARTTLIEIGQRAIPYANIIIADRKKNKEVYVYKDIKKVIKATLFIQNCLKMINAKKNFMNLVNKSSNKKITQKQFTNKNQNTKFVVQDSDDSEVIIIRKKPQKQQGNGDAARRPMLDGNMKLCSNQRGGKIKKFHI